MTEMLDAMIVCALKRAMTPVDSGELYDHVAALGEDAGWTAAKRKGVTRQVVARRLRTLVQTRHAQQVGVTVDRAHRRAVPTFGPIDGYDPHAEVPNDDAGTPADGAYTTMSPAQLLAVVQVGDEVAGAVVRFMRDVQDIQARAKRALHAVDIEPTK